nr:beta-ketoacyl synthase N-terminal-like domain-containing protein [Trichococcus flocculiformis]
MNRVVITGMGAITPLGNTVTEFWDGIKNGKNGIAAITNFDASETGISVAGEVKDFDATKYMDRKEYKRMDLFSQYAVAASAQAVEQSGIDMEKIDADRFGVTIGSGVGGFITMESGIIKMHEKGPKRVPPMFVPMAIGNMAGGNT